LDASSLLMPLMRFVSATDPRMVSTIRAICRQLMMGSLVLRYEIGTAAR
jgi:GH15 family glucan-1,4-alpha-glucosidase